MIWFLIKGIIRDRSRSLFPIIIVTITVTLIIFFKGFMTGIMNNFFKASSIVSTGHVKITTTAYNEESQLLPNDLSILDSENFLKKLKFDYPEYFWTPRITFAGLLDVPNKDGETLEQGTTLAIGIDFFGNHSRQIELWELEKKLLKGRLPNKENEILISSSLSKQLNLKLNDVVTFIGSTMHGAFTTYNFIIAGIFSLNMGPVDKQMILLDINGARLALDMQDASSEILGYKHSLYYDDKESVAFRTEYNKKYNNNLDAFSPIMLALRDSNQMGAIVDFNNAFLSLILGIFMSIVIIVLWNMGLMNGLRRYGEIGMRLAIGESKGKVYRSMITESFVIGMIGTTLGTIIGLLCTYYFQEVGLDYSEALEKISTTNIILPNVFYAKITPDLYYLGYIPGVLATMIGTMLAGRSIYKREMAELFKELES